MSNTENRTVYFLSCSGNYYTFSFNQLDADFQDVGAVYIFTRENNGNFESLYIGQTNKLLSCIKQHDKWVELHRRFVNSICVFYEEDDATRQKMVDELIIVQSPSCSE